MATRNTETLDRKLAACLAGRQKGLQLRFQPIYALTEGSIVRWEALLRWSEGRRRCGARTVLLAAARLRVEDDLLSWVLNEIADVLDRLPPATRIAMNVSAAALNDPGRLFRSIERASKDRGLEPWRVELEITETVALVRTAPAQRAVQELRALGFTVAIDDFGAAYSDIETLRCFPVDRLKVDGSLMRFDPGRARDPLILRWIVGLQDMLDLPLTMEGIETEDHLFVARELEFREAQGFYLARPIGRNDLIDRAGRHPDARLA